MDDKLKAVKVIITGLILLGCFSLKAATYYVSSSSGSDSYSPAQATNQATPWQTIAKVNAVMSSFQPGDLILFKRGDTFSGTLIITVSGTSGHPITFGAWGTSTAKPVLDNRLDLTGWTNVGSNVWEASNSSLTSQPTALFVNNVPMALGRYPNSDAPNGGYLTVTSHPAGSKTVFTDNTLSAATNWTGAEVVLRADNYVLNRLTVASQSGQTITLASGAQCEIKDQYGYFFQNSPAALDRDGEWCYLAATKKIRLYSLADPSTKSVKVANSDHNITISSKSFLVIDGLKLTGSNLCAVKLLATTYCTIRNCDFIASGTNAINIGTFGSTDNDSITVANNYFFKTQSNCINAYGKRLNFSGNTLKQTGIVPGMAQSGQYAFGIYTLADGLNIERNVIDSTGSSGIDFLWSGNVMIKENSLNNFCTVIDDGGGIYCWGDPSSPAPLNRKIMNNVILNGVGAAAGTSATCGKAEGIYIDDRSPNVEINGNTVAFCSNSGIFLHNSPQCTVKNNTIFACKHDLWIGHDGNAPGFPVTNCTIQNNLLATKELDASKSELFLYQTTDATNLANLGSLDNNIYCQPFLNSDYIEYKFENSSTGFSLCDNLPEWVAYSGFDGHSKLSPVSYPVYSKMLTTNGISNGTFSANTNGWGSWNPATNTSTVKWVNDQLDGGSLALTVAGTGGVTSSRLSTTLPSITSGKTYLLRISNRATLTGKVNFFLIEDVSPYRSGSEVYTINVCANRADKELLVSATNTLASPSIFFMSGPENGTVYFDNVEFYEVTPTNPDDCIRFEYNATATVKYVTADKGYTTPLGVNYAKGSAVPVPAFGSVVLLKADVAAAVEPKPLPADATYRLYPNPAIDTVYVGRPDETHPEQAVVYDVAGKELKRQYVSSGTGISVAGWPKGIYVVVFPDRQPVKALKLVKN